MAVPDPVLQQQLKERIERAKAEIKQQLSPLFRVSQALRLGQQDPAQAAQALEEVAAADRGGLGLLAGRPGSSLLEPLGSLPGSPAGAPGAEAGESGPAMAGVAWQAGEATDADAWRIGSSMAGAEPLPACDQSALRDNPLFEEPSLEALREQPGPD